VDLQCGRCFDPYLGSHVDCGAMTYYDCEGPALPKECRPFKCVDQDVKEV